MSLSIEQISNTLKEKFGPAIISQDTEYDFTVFTIDKHSIVPIFRFLYDDEQFQFRYLTTACAIQFPGRELPFAMMYQLHSLTHNSRIRFKAYSSANDLQYDTITGIFPSANWMEREAWDFFGIRFKGHPNLKRILNVEDMDYHPMRKEYPLEDLTRYDKDDSMFGRQKSPFTKKLN